MTYSLPWTMVGLVCSSLLVGACGDGDASTTGGGGGTGNSASSTATSVGPICGGQQCALDQICGFAIGDCAAQPSCQPGTGCSDDKVVCGCDGKNYPNKCQADLAGVAAMDGACAPPPGKFTCNYEHQVPIYCDVGTQYCEATMSGNDVYPLACKPIPSTCGDPVDCSCLPCSDFYCAVDPMNGAASVICQM